MLRVVRLTSERPFPRATVEDELLPLAQAAGDGDVAALRTLLTCVGPQILRVVRRVVGAQHPEVEDIAQECAVEFANALSRFRGESSVSHFCSRVALGVAMNKRRRHRAQKRAWDRAEAVEADDADGQYVQPDQHAAARASVALARALCDELPPAQAEVLALHCVLGYTRIEVAAICGAPLETMRSRLRAAKSVLMARARAEPRLSELLEDLR